ncbi:BadF/BadG/BcrA/BcrD ATPase family protein [Rosenbergiella nectarea]|uniref:BadF/BadG/BcrA/BcrD ATPase family protein n=1 Tax=Rosenbergiella nectarea TaxID=988801 RepID=UPI001BDB1048|nr:BadF/BadG/BcrA/BcrD ATPase family protein [Rosenbergiella nectarea]MBT0730387.1 N-acetylglucosamine kinase [Rosenbergiella nectarea subsp. apis]
MTKYRIGIDGGGTHCRGRLVDNQGNLLAECSGGTGNVYSHYESALSEVKKVITELYTLANLTVGEYGNSVLVAGLAGANVPSVIQRLTEWCIPNLQHKIVSDVETACFGAHQGEAGAIFICGTGSQGAIWDGQRFKLMGGWGFMLSDLASGAGLGQKALRRALLAHEGIIENSPCMNHIMSTFQDSPEQMLLWTQKAQPKDWAHYAKVIFDYAKRDDRNALRLVKQCAAEAETMIKALIHASRSDIALLGGITAPITPWLSNEIRERLIEPKGDALDGAILLGKRLWG